MKKTKYIFLLLAVIAAFYGSFISTQKKPVTVQEALAQSTYLNSQLDKFKAESKGVCSKSSSNKNLLDAIDAFNKSPNGDRGAPDICPKGEHTYLLFSAYRDPGFEIALWQDGKMNFFKSPGGFVAGFGGRHIEFLPDVFSGTSLIATNDSDSPGFYWSYTQLDPKTLISTQIEKCKMTFSFNNKFTKFDKEYYKVVTTNPKLNCEKEYKL